MDDSRFDAVTRLIGQGASRRRVLKGLLGIGAAAATGSVVVSDSGARGGSQTRISPPPPPAPTPTPTPAPADPCPGLEQCALDGCCEGTCTERGRCCRTDLGRVVCGEDCCDAFLQCCDGSCCPEDYTCLTRVFLPSALIKEETCCLDDRTCDQRCCDGTCFSPIDSGAAGYDRSCCPSEEGFTFCAGLEAFSEEGLCCSGATPDCCHEADGRPICLTSEQCCSDAECRGLTDPARCLEGFCGGDFFCDSRTVCDGGDRCCEGGVDACCPVDQECCGGRCCGTGLSCCEQVFDGATTFTCIDRSRECCTQADCVDPLGYDSQCVDCDQETHACVARDEGVVCDGTECRTCDDRICVDTAEECPAVDACTPAACQDGLCNEESICQGGTPQCCVNALQQPVCISAGFTCCQSDVKCAELNQCTSDGYLTFTCNPTAGYCVGVTAACDDGNACTVGSCEEGAGCVHSPRNCNDGNPCTTDNCNPSTGCVNSPLASGTIVDGGICCGDGDFRAGGNCCTFNDCVASRPPCHSLNCVSNVCQYSDNCNPAPNPECQVGFCNEDTSQCRIVTTCSGATGLGEGALCDFGCQCQSQFCSRIPSTDPARCRSGGVGAPNSFCPIA